MVCAAWQAVQPRASTDAPPHEAAPGRLEDLTLRHLQWRLGRLRLELEEARLQGVAVRDGAGREWQLQAETLHLRGLRLWGELRARAAHAGGWRLDALEGLEGVLRVFVVDAAWIVDADITLPLQHGRLDFDRVAVEHVGPDSAMGISRGGVYLDAPHLGRRYLYVFTAGEVPGAEYGHRAHGGPTRRGALDLKALLEGLLDARRTGPLGRPAEPRLYAMLDRTRLAGELQCGDGVLAAPGLRVVMSGKPNGRNRVGLSAPAVGREMLLRLPALQLSETSLALAAGQASTGLACGSAEMAVQILRQGRGEAPSGLRLDLRVEQAVAHQLSLSLPLVRSARPGPAAKPVHARSG